MLHSWRLTSVAALLGLIAGAAGAQPTTDVPQATVAVARPSSITIAYSQYLWPKVAGVATVYYVIDAASDPNATPNINAAISTSNADFQNILQWVPLPSNSSANFVDINLSADDASGVCEANEGYEEKQGQPMSGSTDCTIGTILHEMGHVIGLWHEQSRADSASYITINYPDVVKGAWSNFLPNADDQQILGPYDYASVMQYIPYAFTATGEPVIETIPAGIPLAGYAGVPAQMTAAPAQPVFDYSAGDKEAIERLYGAAPTQVTVTSNPVGLSVLVDGATVTTPQTYSWAIYSTHTLGVPADVQTLSGAILNSNPVVAATYYYTYGSWNDGGAQSHSILVTPGDGSVPFPTAAPKLATYAANFIQLVPYTSTIDPAASGTVAASPQPQTYPGVAGQFFVARQQVTLTASPATNWDFYEFNNSPFWLPGGLGANPKTFNVPDTGLAVNPTVEFTKPPVYKVDVQPETYSANMGVSVDGTFFYTPKNFAPKRVGGDPTWTANSTHHLVVNPTQKPYSFNSQFVFSKWTGKDVDAPTGTIENLPSASNNYTAAVTREFQPATNFDYPPCGGTAAITPASTEDGFYSYGQKLTFTATPDSGWTFAGWSYDRTVKTNPTSLTTNGESLVFANFNTVATPLTLTRLNPGSASLGGPAFTLELIGTGFDPHNSYVFANGQYRTVTYVSPTLLKVPMTAADKQNLGGFQVYVENFPSGWSGCAVYAYQTFLVRGKGAPAATPSFSPQAGKYTGTQSVSISDALTDPTLAIYYTTDGATPTTSSPKYAGAITVSSSQTLKAIAVVTGYLHSAVAIATYKIN